MLRIPEGSTPDLKNKSYTITAEVEVPQGGANGVLSTQGGRFGGWGLLVIDDKPLFAYALSNQPQHKFKVASNERLSPGKHTIRFDFKYDGGGSVRVGQARCPWTENKWRSPTSSAPSAAASPWMKPLMWR
jgi:hypothetical protein